MKCVDLGISTGTAPFVAHGHPRKVIWDPSELRLVPGRLKGQTRWASVGDSAALKASGSGRIVPIPDGTHLIMGMELEPHGLFKLATALLRRRLRSMYKRDVNNIKTRFEGDSGLRRSMTLQFVQCSLQSGWAINDE